MAEERMAFPDALRKGEEPAEDPLREIVRWTIQELMEAEVAGQIGAGRYERSLERSTHRNGYRPRTWDTRVGSLELQIPKLRQGSYFPSWLAARRAGLGGGGGGSVRARREHAEGRSARPSAGDQRHLAE